MSIQTIRMRISLLPLGKAVWTSASPPNWFQATGDEFEFRHADGMPLLGRQSVLTPTTTVSFPWNAAAAAADCCSNTFTVQVLRQVVRRNCESVYSRSPGRTQAIQ